MPPPEESEHQSNLPTFARLGPPILAHRFPPEAGGRKPMDITGVKLHSTRWETGFPRALLTYTPAPHLRLHEDPQMVALSHRTKLTGTLACLLGGATTRITSPIAYCRLMLGISGGNAPEPATAKRRIPKIVRDGPRKHQRPLGAKVHPRGRCRVVRRLNCER